MIIYIFIYNIGYGYGMVSYYNRYYNASITVILINVIYIYVI